MGDVERAQLVQMAQLAKQYGIGWHHCRDSRWCLGAPGMPDLVLVGPSGLMFRELKASPQVMTRDQVDWKWRLRAAGVDVGLWLPGDFRAGRVEQQIAAIGRRR